MAKYVDGYVIPIQKKNLAAYRRMALKAGKIWREHGALAVYECAGEDLSSEFCIPFPKQMKSKPGETVVFSWVVFKSKAQRNKVNAKVMADPRLQGMDEKNMPFDCKRVVYGGFTPMVSLE